MKLKYLVNLLPIPLILLFLTGCATSSVAHEETADGILEQYIELPFSQAVASFGPPNYIYNDGANGSIFHYDKSYTTTTPGVSYTQSEISLNEYIDNVRGTSVTVNRPPQTRLHERFVQFYIDEDDTIYHYRHNVEAPAEVEARERAEKTNYWTKVTLYTLGISAAVLIALSAGGGH